MWTYWWYADPGPKASDPWRAWYDSRQPAVRAKHDSVFRFLEGRENWTEPHTKKIGDLVEVRLTGKVQHRLVGAYWPKGKFQYTMLITCTHKDDVYDPKDALETAEKRLKELKAGSKWIRRCDRPS